MVCVCFYAAVFNVAIGKPTYQSSTRRRNRDGYTFPSSNAVDGTKTHDARQNSSSMTQDETNPWWAVDMVDSCVVDTLEITFAMYWYCAYDHHNIHINNQRHCHIQGVNHFPNFMSIPTKCNTSNNTCINYIHQSKNIKIAYANHPCTHIKPDTTYIHPKDKPTKYTVYH